MTAPREVTAEGHVFDQRLVDLILDKLDALVVILNPDGEIVYFNAACERLTGYSSDEVRGRKPWDFLLDPSDAMAATEAFREMAGGALEAHPRHAWLTKSGRRLIVEWSNGADRNSEGNLQYVIGTGVDVTAEARFEEAFRDGERRFSAIVDTVPDAMLIIDASGTIRFANRATERQFGYPADELIGNNVSMIAPEPYASEHAGHLEHYFQTGEKRIIGKRREVRGKRKDGTIFPMELSVGEFRDGTPYFVGFAHDITARKEAEHQAGLVQSQLRRVSRLTALGELGSVLAHELNQPLTAVVNYTEALRRALGKTYGETPLDIVSLLDKSVDQAHRAGQTLTRLKAFAVSGQLTPEIDDINEVVEEAVRLVTSETQDQHASLHVALAENLPPVLVERLQVQIVLLNLLRNSLDALEGLTEKNIYIRTEVDAKGFVDVCVSDTGSGIPTENADRLFEPFATTKESGTGLGLSISRSIVEAHGGKIWLETKTDRGAEFHFTLPLAEDLQPAHAN